MKITKSLRQTKLREILKRWGSMEKSDIDSKMANLLQVDLTAALKRALYRDLEDLVQQGELDVKYFTRDGAEITYFESSTHKNFYNIWSLAGDSGAVTGHALINNTNTCIHVMALLKNDVAISEYRAESETDRVNLIFSINSQILCLKIKKESLPFKIIFSRFTGEVKPNEVQQLKEKHGQRLIILKLSSSNLSSFKENLSIGHAILSINEKSEISLKDFSTKNGTKYHEIKPVDLPEIKKQITATIGDQTTSLSWNQSFKEVIFKKVNDTTILNLPAFIELGLSTRLLLI